MPHLCLRILRLFALPLMPRLLLGARRGFAIRYTGSFILALIVASFGLTGCRQTWQGTHARGDHNHSEIADHRHAPVDAEQPTTASNCTCQLAQLHNGWCNECDVGYVAAQRISSKLLFDTLDAHGHDVNLDAITCSSCLTAIPNEDFCEQCRMGIVNGKAYFSRLTHVLAKGEVHDASQLNCATCRANSEDLGWCDACRVGMIGNVALTNRHDFESAITPFRTLQSAIEKTASCEMCACAMVADSRCPYCKITYHNGEPVPVPSGKYADDT